MPLPPVDPVPDTRTDTLASQAVPELDRARSRSVRLVISIPVLTLLVVLGSGTVLYSYLLDVAERWYVLPLAKADLERAAITILWLSIAISLVSGVVGYVLARQIVRPIKDLIEMMEQLGEGDLETKLEPVRLGEFTQLGSTFNRMVDQLNHLFEERDRQLHEAFSGGHLVVTRHGNIVKADENMRRVFGLSPEELLGRNVLDSSSIPMLKNNPRFFRLAEEMIEATLKGQTASRSITIRKADDSPPIRLLVSALRLESNDDTSQVMMEIRDITGIASFYEQIQRADRLAAVGTLATGIAHEVRNPLASIRGMVQLLSEASSNERESWDYHRRILVEVDRVEKLIAGVMDFANAEDSAIETVDVNALLADVAQSVRLHLGDPANAIELKWELDRSVPLAVLRGERLRQAFINLLTNAYQHCFEIRRGPIRIVTLHNPDRPQRPITICISNPGQPIDDQTADRIFEPFFTTKSEGTGLGLPIAYQVVQSNGGTLELECEEGEIRFWMQLPLEAGNRDLTSKSIRRLQTSMLGPEESFSS